MRIRFDDKKITGVLSVVPKNCVTFDEEMENYKADPRRTRRLKKVMGYDRHRLAPEGAAVSDLAVFGLESLLSRSLLKKEDISALIVVTESPDYFLPSTGSVIHGRLGLPKDVYCVDINQGCAGYISGLIEAFSLLSQPDMKKVVLVNAEILSRKTSREDRGSWPLVGDAAAITIAENSPGAPPVHGEIMTDGSGADFLIIPAGGFRTPSSPETAVMTEDAEGNRRSLDHIAMKGREVFHFVQTEVPPLIEGLLERIGVTKEKIGWYLFHQPNKFMVEKLAEAIGIPFEKCPSNIVTNFGNASGVTIPMNITFNLGERLTRENLDVCLAGFGVGLTWGAMVTRLGEMDFCEMIEF